MAATSASVPRTPSRARHTHFTSTSHLPSYSQAVQISDRSSPVEEKEHLLHEQYQTPYNEKPARKETEIAIDAGSDGGTKKKEGAEKPASRGMVIFSVLFYLVAALVMVMANKWVLNSVPVPLFFLFIQLAIAVVLLHLSSLFGYFTIPTISLATCRGLLPLISINVLGLIFNTFCLQYVDASFYQVARGLVLPFTAIFSFLLLSAKSSKASLAAVLVVCIGFFLGVSAESLHTSTIGTLLGVFSSLTTSVHAIVVKKSLGVVKGSTMDLVYYNNLLSALLLFPLVYFSGEGALVSAMVQQGGAALRTFLVGATITGLFGFLICIAGFLSIKVTSPVTHMVSGAVRGVFQTFLGMWLFDDVITTGRASGIFFILLGSTLYTYAKEQEARAREALSASSSLTLPSSSPNRISEKRSGLPLSINSSSSPSDRPEVTTPTSATFQPSASATATVTPGSAYNRSVPCDSLSATPRTPSKHSISKSHSSAYTVCIDDTLRQLTRLSPHHTPAYESAQPPQYASPAHANPFRRLEFATPPSSGSAERAGISLKHSKSVSSISDLREIVISSFTSSPHSHGHAEGKGSKLY